MKQIKTDLAPQAIGTYSQAIQVDKIIYLSGQIPLDPKTMEVCSPDFKAQAIQTFENIAAVVTAGGSSLARIAKMTVYLTDLAYFNIVNDVMRMYFKEPYPARAVIGVHALPKGVLIEIDAIISLE